MPLQEQNARKRFLPKVVEIRLTHIYSLLFCLSRETRDSFTLECVLRTFGTANWLNFVPLALGSLSEPRAIAIKIEFFLWSEMYVNRWFFDIYIQGSKKIQL